MLWRIKLNLDLRTLLTNHAAPLNVLNYSKSDHYYMDTASNLCPLLILIDMLTYLKVDMLAP